MADVSTRTIGILPMFAWRASARVREPGRWLFDKHGIVPFCLGGPPPAGANRASMPGSWVVMRMASP